MQIFLFGLKDSIVKWKFHIFLRRQTAGIHPETIPRIDYNLGLNVFIISHKWLNYDPIL